MATVTNVSGQVINVQQASLIQSTDSSTETLAQNVDVTVVYITPTGDSIPYWDEDNNFTVLTLAQVADKMANNATAQQVLQTAAISAGVNTQFKMGTFYNLTSIEINPTAQSLCDIILNQASTNLLLDTFTDTPGFARQLTLRIKQGTGSNNIVWPDAIKWEADSKPTLSYIAGEFDWIVLTTLNSGTTWSGVMVGSWNDA